MKNEKEIFAKPFCEKTYIDVSICKSNIKEKTYYAKPCLSGFIKSDELLKRLKKRAPYVDETVMRAALQELSSLMVNLIGDGKTVEFFSLGSFSLGTKGKVEVSEQSYLQDENMDIARLDAKRIDNATSGGYNLDVSPFIKTKPTFILKFEQSQLVKKTLEKMEVNVAIKKKRAPTIAQITRVSKSSNQAHTHCPTILRIRGEDLKIVSHVETTEADEAFISKQDKQVGVYIEEGGKRKKLPDENIIKNTPRELLVILDEKLEDSKAYNLAITTQYVKMGSKRVGHLLRSTKVKFRMDELEVEKPSARLKRTFTQFRAVTIPVEQMQDCPINKNIQKWSFSLDFCLNLDYYVNRQWRGCLFGYSCSS